jgi:hypothetical protein
MERTLPEDLSKLEPEGVDAARKHHDARADSLFRRWPALTRLEHAELRRMFDERVRLAKHVGWLRSRGRRHQGVS